MRPTKADFAHIRDGVFRACYSVCQHRGHALLSGAGVTSRIMCPYHAWTFRLDGRFLRAPETDNLRDFDGADIWLHAARVEDIALVQSVQMGMASPAFNQGRFVCDPSESGKSEHSVDRFHGLVLDVYAAAAP